MFAILLLTGANVPLAELPGFLLPLSSILPLTRSVEAARIVSSGGDLGSGLGFLAIDAAVGTLWALTGLALFSWIETQARRRGSLEGF
jgi:ABC-2 type transport system permease protein